VSQHKIVSNSRTVDEIYPMVTVQRLTDNAVLFRIVATVPGSIPASSDTVDSEGRQMKKC
jgi:hypothetical protein